jgi:sulfite oxidase
MDILTKESMTPNGLHFVRYQNGMPDIDATVYDIRLDGLLNDPKKLTLADLQHRSTLPRVLKRITIQYSGTRRIEQIVKFAGEGDEMINAPRPRVILARGVLSGCTASR